MIDQSQTSQIVFTNKARCRDCYRCVRMCPVKAIQLRDGQADVVADRCILCGTCIRECPQGAKSFRNDVHKASCLTRSSAFAAASIAPSFASLFQDWQRRRLPSALRRLGFSYVGETAIGADFVADEMSAAVRAKPDSLNLCSVCPVVVRYVECYQPQRVDQLVPVVSPMIAHARHIKQKLGEDAKVVHIGPCVARKAEAEREELVGAVDCVLTFKELLEWFELEGIDLSACEESDFDEFPSTVARLFPLEGGLLRTSGWKPDILDAEVVSASGPDEVMAILDCPVQNEDLRLVEPLFCRQGCINGPAMTDCRSVFRRRNDILRYAVNEVTERSCADPPPLSTSFQKGTVKKPLSVSEQQIHQILKLIGQENESDRLDCGACGYATCREKAIAVANGLAEAEMCIPYMRRLAKQRTDRIIETSPNGIVILDNRFRILHMNPAFRKLFNCSDAVAGKPISHLMDPGPFERLSLGENDTLETTVEHERYGIVCHQIMYQLREEKQYVGIFVNITQSRINQQKLDRVRAETVIQAQELLRHQLDMAETIARCLGESTARGESLVEKLMLAATQEPNEPVPNESVSQVR